MVISIAAFVESSRASKRESYVVAREILTDLTSGEIGHARDVIGTLRYGNDAGWRVLDYSDIINQYYLLEWALERAGYGIKGLRPAGHQVQDSMVEAITWHIDELVTALVLLHDAFGHNMADDETWKHLDSTIEIVGLTRPKANPNELAKIRSRIETLRDLPLAGQNIEADSVSEHKVKGG